MAEDALRILSATLGAYGLYALDLDASGRDLLAGDAAGVRRELAGPLASWCARMAQGATDAMLMGERRARRVGSTLVIQGADRVTDIAARESGQFSAWRRAISPWACGACMASASDGSRGLDTTFDLHPGCSRGAAGPPRRSWCARARCRSRP